MPLSEEEMRLLEQMERALVQEDPRLAHTLRGTAHRLAARRRVWLAGLGLLAGVALLMGGAMSQLTFLGVLGFLVMLGSATVGLAAWRAQRVDTTPASATEVPTLGASPRGINPPEPTFLERFVRRFRRD